MAFKHDVMIKCTDWIGIWRVGFCGGWKTRKPTEKPLEKGQEPTTNSTHMWRWVWESNPGHSGGRRVLSQLCHPCTRTSCCGTILPYWIKGSQVKFCQGKYLSYLPGWRYGSLWSVILKLWNKASSALIGLNLSPCLWASEIKHEVQGFPNKLASKESHQLLQSFVPDTFCHKVY